MKRIIFILVVLALFGCKEEEKPKIVEDLKELKTMYEQDQADRQDLSDWKKIMRNDSIHLKRVKELLDSSLIQTGKDHYRAAMIFQHGNDSIDSGLAVKMMKKAVALDTTINKWLLAAAIDRDLMRRNKPQIYGTQFTRSEGEPWRRYKIDSTKVTDEVRKSYGVRTLAEQRKKVKELNEREDLND